jgi:hypothetical protein
MFWHYGTDLRQHRICALRNPQREKERSEMSDAELPPSVVGAWLIHHEQKLSAVSVNGFEATKAAGKTARVLSLITREKEWSIPIDRVKALAQSNQVNRLELNAALSALTAEGLIDQSASEVTVLGVTQATLLSHAASIFEAQQPDDSEQAAIALAELVSTSPLPRADCAENVSDTFHLSKADTDQLLSQAEGIGFVDYDGADDAEKFYFNGALFRRESAKKAALILQTLKPDEVARLAQADELMAKSGCILKAALVAVLGDALWGKMHQVGFYDVSTVSNQAGNTEFVTKPGALSKYVPGSLADMLDDAKALASSLTYGIAVSSPYQGQIRMPSVLLDRLVNRGYVEGHVSAIATDYHVPEQRGIVQVTRSSAGNRLTLLKKEVGEMARELILRGDASGAAAGIVASGVARSYQGPEAARVAARKPFVGTSSRTLRNALDILRK